jgi:hypothetical protein
MALIVSLWPGRRVAKTAEAVLFEVRSLCRKETFYIFSSAREAILDMVVVAVAAEALGCPIITSHQATTRVDYCLWAAAGAAVLQLRVTLRGRTTIMAAQAAGLIPVRAVLAVIQGAKVVTALVAAAVPSFKTAQIRMAMGQIKQQQSLF